jgi:hypothetical protein
VIKNEISFYEEFSKKFSEYLNTYLGCNYIVYYSCNKSLDLIMSDLEMQSGIIIKQEGTYIPQLKIDIVFSIINPNKKVRFILIEAKYLNQLSLKDYSQLVGYLQVAKNIDLGLLLLIQKGMSAIKLSNDFQEIIRLKKLPMDWFIDIKRINEQYNFKTGIISYLPAGGIDWINTSDIDGISSFEELIKILKTD